MAIPPVSHPISRHEALSQKGAETALFFVVCFLLEAKGRGIPPSPGLVFQCAAAGFLIAIALESVRTQKAQLTWDTITFMFREDHALGFRLAGSLRQAEQQRENGFRGDALNLDISDSETWRIFNPEDRPDANGFTERQKWLLWPERVALENRRKLIQFWEQGVESFIENRWTQSNSAFLLIDYGSGGKEGAYDFKYGKGLGKKGVQSISPHQVIAIIGPPALPLQGRALIAYYRSSLIIAIQAYQETCRQVK